ncbi:TetR/AcrR family transcriptional regulator [Actinomadura sp. K4S16]|uniref:TetR/AcrR family transcriptional regulator n=1 Tax=Actinomadura sp. K4S16 TaxID=1316147 RepID=UPI0011F02FAD|nr:TetR/AcrR family transcriptional regulator [Actinomadura sp. K4S16]
MQADSSAAVPVLDRRVRRSRSALIRAAIALVSERGTAAVPLSDIAEAADVSRQVVYQQFGNRDSLLLEAALDLARRELLPGLGELADISDVRVPVLAVAGHFADHRPFYRAVLTGSSGFGLNKALTGFFIPYNRHIVQLLGGGRLGPQEAEDLAAFLTGGWAALINDWIADGDDPLDPARFTDRLVRMVAAAIDVIAGPCAAREDERPGG